MSMKGRVKLKSGVRKLKLQGRGPALSAAERRAKTRKGIPVNPEEMKGFLPDKRGNKGASNQGDKPRKKFANAQNQSKGRRMKKSFSKPTLPSPAELHSSVRIPPSSDVLMDVRAKLDDHGELDSTLLDVEVDHHVVTLKGSVAAQNQKTLAGQLARDVWGVRRVKNEIRVQSAGIPRRRAA
jgi:osmotically-inducible protein OsmY